MNFPDHFHQSQLPTPIVPFKRFFNSPQPYEIYMKRDDLSGIELSGNKVRKLDFLLKDAQNHGASHIITCGGLQSNHCRATAFYATKLGLECSLVLRGNEPKPATGNLMLNQILGTRIEYVSAEAYQQVQAYMEIMAAKYEGTSYIIPEGGSNFMGAWGYVKAFYEIMEQSPGIETIVVATGSGGTHAGLLLGKLISGKHVNIISVNVCDDAAFFKQKINSIIKDFAAHFNFDLSWDLADIQIEDGYVGAGYGEISEREISIIKRLAHTEGIVIDPVYGAKALAGFEKLVNQGKLPGNKILFIHTGGIFGIFPYAEMF